MDVRTLSLNLISAKGLKKPAFARRMDTYAVAYISDTTHKVQAQRTCTHKNSDSNPTWNFPMKFIIDEAAALQNHLTLVVKIKRVDFFGVKNLGEVRVSLKELLHGGRKTMQNVSYQVIRSSGKPKGALSFTYEFDEEFAGKPVEPSTPPRAYDTYPSQHLGSSMKLGLLGGGGLGGMLLSY